MKGTLAKRERQCSAMEKVATKAVSDKDAVEKELAEANARWARAVEEKLAARSTEEASRAEADSRARRVLDLEGELAILRADLEAETTAKEGLRAKLAEAVAESAREKKAREEAVSESAKQGVLLNSLSSRLAAAEQGTEAAKAEAVESFKDSQAFADAVAECSADSYQLGFADCKESTAKLYPEWDLSGVNIPGSEDEDEEAPAREVAVLADAPADDVDGSAPAAVEAEGPLFTFCIFFLCLSCSPASAI